MCGDIYASPKVQVSDTVCNHTCPGNPSQTCGGFIGPTYYVSVYNTNALTVTLATVTFNALSHNYIGCFLGPGVFLGGMTSSQAAAENPNVAPVDEGVSNYWYFSSLLSGDMCIQSCFKYGFLYGGIEA